jgi:lysophosphatidate acyltransferase
MIPVLLGMIATLVKAFAAFFLAAVLLGGLASVHQERKIWKNPKLPSLGAFALFKVYLMNVAWMLLCAGGSCLTPLYCLATGSWETRKWAHSLVERHAAQFLCNVIIAPVEVVGMENMSEELLYKSPAPVIIANHDSQIDLAAVYFLNREWRWIAKSSVMMLPGVGQLMWLSGHVFIDRIKKKSGSSGNSRTGARNLYIQSNASIQSGVPMFFFPQGTRRLGERLPFKDGAFKIALENKSKLIPVSLEIPMTAWNSWYPLTSAVQPIKITVHPAMETTGKDIETLKKESFDTIYSVLPDYTKQS